MCIQPLSNVCCVCTHTVLSWKTLSATMFVCTVGPVSHPGYKDNARFFHTVTTTVCVVSSAKHKNATFCIELFSYLLSLFTSPLNDSYWINPLSHFVCRRSVKSMRELSGKQPVGALMKVTLLPYREVKLLHLAITTWGHTACMALEMTVR